MDTAMRVTRFSAKREFVIGLVVVMLCLNLNGCSGKAPETDATIHQPVTESSGAAVIAAEKVYTEAYLHRNWEAAAALLAPDYYVNAEGIEGDVAKLKQEFPKIQLLDYQVLSEPHVKSLASDLALYNDTGTMRETYAGRDISGHYWHGDIWGAPKRALAAARRTRGSAPRGRPVSQFIRCLGRPRSWCRSLKLSAGEEMVRVLIGSCIVFALTGALCAQTRDDLLSARADEAVTKLRQQQRIPGTSLAVVRDGKIIKVASYGLANVELNVPVKPETIFPAASLTKQFTATAVMLLVEEGKVGLDDSITKYFPEAPATWKPITIRHLLSHTSGIRDVWGETENDAFTAGLIDTRHDYTENELVRIYVKLPRDFKPGDKWDYCSTGYELLGFLIHRATGMSYFDFLQQRIFKPLNMNATRLYNYVDVVPNLASGYAWVNGELKHPAWIAPSLYALADGGLLTNVYDLAKWDAALYTETILERDSLKQMWTPSNSTPARHSLMVFAGSLVMPMATT